MSLLQQLSRWLREIQAGESARGNRSGLHANEDGMLSFVSLLTVVFFLVLLALVGNVGKTVNEKIEVQNTADSVAYSSACWMARGMNSITAVNHLIGELMSFVVLYDAIGVRNSSEQAQAQVLQTQVAALRAAAQAGKIAATGTPAFDSIDGRKRFDIHVEDTVKDGKANLIDAFTTLYTVKAAAGALESSDLPPLQILGYAIDVLALVIELYAWAEWEVLDALEQLARPLYEPVRKQLLMNGLLPLCQMYADVVAAMVPDLASKSAQQIAQANHCTGAVDPEKPKLPLGTDPYAEDTGDEFGKSQIVRATYPWVVYRRRPILGLMSWMKISGAADLYLKYTNQWSIKSPKEFYDDKQLFMLVIDDPQNPGQMKSPGKGNESWTNDTVAADRLFGVIGFAHRAAPKPFADRIFIQPNPQGLAAYAQAIIWNANLQDPGNTPAQYQPQVGWDTLNWSRPVADSHSYEYPEDPGKWSQRHDWAPVIRVNWQVRLVPVGADRLNAAANRVAAPFQGVMNKTDRLAPQFRTH